MATEIKKGPLTQTILIVNCELVEWFPAITASAKYYTPIGQYTVDYANMLELAILNYPSEGTVNVKVPYWMTYTKMKGDYGNMLVVISMEYTEHHGDLMGSIQEKNQCLQMAVMDALILKIPIQRLSMIMSSSMKRKDRK